MDRHKLELKTGPKFRALLIYKSQATGVGSNKRSNKRSWLSQFNL